MKSKYIDNIYFEQQGLLKKKNGQGARCKPRDCRARRKRKLLKYFLMSMGEFGIAKLFNNQGKQNATSKII